MRRIELLCCRPRSFSRVVSSANSRPSRTDKSPQVSPIETTRPFLLDIELNVLLNMPDVELSWYVWPYRIERPDQHLLIIGDNKVREVDIMRCHDSVKL